MSLLGEIASSGVRLLTKNARIGENTMIVNTEQKERADSDNYHMRDGIVIIPKDVVIISGAII